MTTTEQPPSPAEQAALIRACNELPPRCREALILVRSGQTYAQVASELKIDEATARRLVERAMEYLIEQVGADSRSLPPWKAGVGVLICAVLAVVIYRDGGYLAACWISACGGMFLQDWAYRFRDKYDPQRRIGNE